jgi:hypothetical protein
MRRFLLTAAAWGLTATMAAAQGMAPGGPVYNSTGIGSGLGGVTGGTGPSYPNGTTAPALPPSVPPGGLSPLGRAEPGPAFAPPPTDIVRRSPYTQPLDPYPLPASHRKIVKDPDAAKDSTDKGKDDGTPPATAL